jgi:oxygen-independent coproporphyrinogen III oxidase
MDDRLLKYAHMAMPRYTSYPTAVQFNAHIGPADYQGWLREITAEKPISLYVHIPFCQSLCWYCGCNTTVPNTYDRVTKYLQALVTEIGLIAENLNPQVKVSHLHFGGGTPSYLEPEHFEQLTLTLKNSFNFQKNAEIAVEADPRTLSSEIIAAFANSGVSRVSLGVQDFNPKVQALINRIQSEELVSDCVAQLKSNGITAINFDLMYGLPGQSVETVKQSAVSAVEMAPDRIAVFGYAHVPWFKKHQKVISTDMLPNVEQRIEQADVIAETLMEEGYVRIGLDHFARPDDSLSIAQKQKSLRRNFQGYTTDTAETLVGLGASSISTMPQGYCQNDPHLGQYIYRLEENKLATVRGIGLSDGDKLRRAAINNLMCHFMLDLAALCKASQRAPDALDDSLPALLALAEDGLVQLDGRLITVTLMGRRFIRNIAACFDQYLECDTQKHSLAV